MQYDLNPPLDVSDLSPEPLAQFQRWLGEAETAGLVEPTAMALASTGADGQPSLRMVLFKGLDDGGLTFFTNYASRKGEELAGNPRVALLFWWDKLQRQLRVEGRAERLPRAASEKYFHSRPRISQIAAAVSRQSQVVGSREELDRRYAELEKKAAGGDIALPESWGGYRVRPERFEFWQGRAGRLHDRIVYEREGAGWRRERLEP